jgi:hypothetical protein
MRIICRALVLCLAVSAAFPDIAFVYIDRNGNRVFVYKP